MEVDHNQVSPTTNWIEIPAQNQSYQELRQSGGWLNDWWCGRKIIKIFHHRKSLFSLLGEGLVSVQARPHPRDVKVHGAECSLTHWERLLPGTIQFSPVQTSRRPVHRVAWYRKHRHTQSSIRKKGTSVKGLLCCHHGEESYWKGCDFKMGSSWPSHAARLGGANAPYLCLKGLSSENAAVLVHINMIHSLKRMWNCNVVWIH